MSAVWRGWGQGEQLGRGAGEMNENENRTNENERRYVAGVLAKSTCCRLGKLVEGFPYNGHT